MKKQKFVCEQCGHVGEGSIFYFPTYGAMEYCVCIDREACSARAQASDLAEEELEQHYAAKPVVTQSDFTQTFLNHPDPIRYMMQMGAWDKE